MTPTTRKVFLDPPALHGALKKRPHDIAEAEDRAAIQICRKAMNDLMVRVEGDVLEIYASFGEEKDKHVVMRLSLEEVLMTAEPEVGFGKDEDAAAIKAAKEAASICRAAADRLDQAADRALDKHRKAWEENDAVER